MSRTPLTTANTLTHASRGDSSWLALVSAATLTSRFDQIRARVIVSPAACACLARPSYRLVVQSYPSHAVVRGHVQEWAEPSASVQRAVTPDELKAGVPVQLLMFAERAHGKHDPAVVVAWVEPGVPNLELDGRAARPGPSSLRARARLDGQAREARLRLRASGV